MDSPHADGARQILCPILCARVQRVLASAIQTRLSLPDIGRHDAANWGRIEIRHRNWGHIQARCGRNAPSLYTGAER